MADFEEKKRLGKVAEENKGKEMALAAAAEEIKRRETEKAKRMNY